MMKTLLLLACAAFISASPVNTKKTILKELVIDLNAALVNTPMKTHEGNTIYLANLGKMTSGLTCKPHYFCQAKGELLKKVSVLSGDKFEPFRKDNTLIRNLNAYNEHHKKICDEEEKRDHSVEEELEEITLKAFLEDLLKCVKHVNSQKS